MGRLGAFVHERMDAWAACGCSAAHTRPVLLSPLPHPPPFPFPLLSRPLQEKVKIREGIKIAMSISADGNKFLQDTTPWVVVKQDKDKCAGEPPPPAKSASPHVPSVLPHEGARRSLLDHST